jgi:O-antigen/teichoic acid export membrane protein
MFYADASLIQFSVGLSCGAPILFLTTPKRGDVNTETVSIKHLHPLKALESTALRASFWTAVEYGTSMTLRVVNSLLLTRLLLPAFFGEITLVTTFVVGINLLSDIGLAPSVIQSPHGDDVDFLNTAWTIQVIRGILLWLVALAICWPMAKFYQDPNLKLLLPVVAFGTIITGFNSTSLLTLSRHMGVRRLFAIDFSSQVVGLIVTVIWAYYRPSVWAIVGGGFAYNCIRLVLSHNKRVAPGISNRFCWDKKSLRGIVHFGRWILLGTALFFFASQADRLILGKLVSFTVLGIYGIAFSLSDIPRSITLAFSSRVGFPFISKIINLPMEEFKKTYFRYRLYVLMIGALLLSVMTVWGNLLVLHLYDHRYAEASWMIPIFSIGLWHTLLYTTTFPVLLALGKSKYSSFGNAAYCVAIVLGIPIAFHWYGLWGAVIAVAAGDFPFYLVVLAGATNEGIGPLWQDLQATGIFIGFLGLCFFFKHLFV